MLEITGKSHRVCSGVTRRDVLRIGGLGLAGFTLADVLKLRAEAASDLGTAKSIIMIHLGGGPSHVDTYDPKPESPAAYRGEFKAIETNVSGIQLGEHFPLQAKRMDRMVVIRSLANVAHEHSSSHTVTGYSNLERNATGDKPSVGSVLAKLRTSPDAVIPSYVTVRGYNTVHGLGAAYLGGSAEPLVSRGPGRDDLTPRLSKIRMASRQKLLAQVDSVRREIDNHPEVAQRTAFNEGAFRIISSSKTYDALDVGKESKATRDRYKNDNFLLARRLVEAGVQCVAVETGGWDTHGNNFNSLRNLMPRLDRSLAALMDDLKDRGLYEETVIVVWGEFGRTPRVNGSAGRDHWPRVMSAMISGGGLKMGQAIGSTDSLGQGVDKNPLHVRDVVATLYHALGIDPKMVFTDAQGRPIQLIHDKEPIPELI